MVESSTLQKVTRLVGIVFVVVGILGFIPGITENAPGDFAGENSPGSLLHVFQTGILHNLVHLLTGVIALLMSRTWEGSRNFLFGFGAVYVVLWALGMASVMDWLPADVTDHWLHLVLGLGLIGAGLLFRGRQPGRDRYAEARA